MLPEWDLCDTDFAAMFVGWDICITFILRSISQRQMKDLLMDDLDHDLSAV